MAVEDVGLLGAGTDINLLVTQVNKQLYERPIKPTNVVSILCSSVAQGEVGKRVVFPWPLFGNAVERLGPYEEQKGTQPEMAKFSMEVDLWGPKGILIPAMTKVSDLYDIAKGNLSSMLAQFDNHIERQFAKLIYDGITAVTDYDGKPFFATNKEANPNKPGFKTFDNYKAGRALDHDGMVQTLDDLDLMPGPDGNLLSMPGDYFCFVSTRNQKKRAADLLDAAVATNRQNTAAITNTQKGDATVLHIPQLANFGSGKLWGVAKIVDGSFRPFAFAQPVKPQVSIEGLSINEHYNVTWSTSKQNIKGVHGLGYLLSQLCVLCVEP